MIEITNEEFHRLLELYNNAVDHYNERGLMETTIVNDDGHLVRVSVYAMHETVYLMSNLHDSKYYKLCPQTEWRLRQINRLQNLASQAWERYQSLVIEVTKGKMDAQAPSGDVDIPEFKSGFEEV